MSIIDATKEKNSYSRAANETIPTTLKWVEKRVKFLAHIYARSCGERWKQKPHQFCEFIDSQKRRKIFL